MSSGFLSTTTGLAKSLGRLIGSSVKAGGKAMDQLSERLQAYADQPSRPEPPPATPAED
ncbi:MAG: hypothetical protein LBD70_04130 [Bifidobacteriaceae bacterium]|jgi:hypothetical protein|nr:hypothetical protein [Bifidobacteriaceae bacterium]